MLATNWMVVINLMLMDVNWIIMNNDLVVSFGSAYRSHLHGSICNNLEYDAQLEVRNLRHPAEIVTVHEVENGTVYTVEVYTDGSKTRDNVGAAGIIFLNGKLVHQLKLKLHGHSSNNQAEKIAILKILEKLEELQEGKDNDKHVAIYTDNKITLDLLQNKFKRNPLIELIRNKLISLVHLKWIVHFGWIKGQARIEVTSWWIDLQKKLLLKMDQSYMTRYQKR